MGQLRQSAPMNIQPVTTNCGARIEGVDLSQAVDDELAQALRDALHRYQVLFLSGQFLDLERQKAVTSVFGEPMRLPYVEPLDWEPQVVAVRKRASETNVGVFGGDWHSDFSFLSEPPAGSVLNAVTVPPVGGDTLWANQVAAFEALDDEMKALLEGRGAVHVGAPYGVKHAPEEETRAAASVRMTRGDPAADAERVHPAVRRHPDSGARALFLNPIYTTRLDGMSEAESAPVLAKLYRHATRPEFCCRHRWQAGDLVVWDNRTTLHYAVNDYDGHERLLYRTTFGDGLAPAG
jgi:taurine dioxygenase